MIKVMAIFGTRPEAIKMAPLILELNKRREIETIVCVTAQHRELLDQVLDAFSIVPDYDLDIMKHGQTLSEITTKILSGLDQIIDEVKPNIILVHGDTTTSLVGALNGYYKKIIVGHVEAGLRTREKYSPWPEEINRQLIDCLSDIYFVPTDINKENLLKENKNESQIYVTGNTVIDVLKSTIKDEYEHPIIDWIGNDRMILLTSHRRESIGEPMKRIFRAVIKIVNEISDVKVVFPVHLNPEIKNIAKEILGKSDKVKLIDPLEVFDFHNFLAKSYLILTDSGGIQEEATALGKPVLVLRKVTERSEGIAVKTLKLVGTNEKNIYEETKNLLNNKKLYNSMSKSSNYYGDGTASKKISDLIIKYFNKQN